MSQLREFAGKGWHEWPSTGDSEDISLASSPSHSDLASGDITPSSSRASSPPPHLNPKDDVTKLPRHEMHLFGQCPVQVNSVLSTMNDQKHLNNFVFGKKRIVAAIQFQVRKNEWLVDHSISRLIIEWLKAILIKWWSHFSVKWNSHKLK
jgi:hypothetical protein